jgi:hypothetical protein
MQKLTLEERISKLENKIYEDSPRFNMPDDIIEGLRKYLQIVTREKYWSKRGIRDYIGVRNWTNYVIDIVLDNWFGYSKEDIEANRPEIEDTILKWVGRGR